jgi:hypothetical protein
MRRLALLLVAAALAAAAASPGLALAADTGTYRISSYRVALTPHSDGTVAVDYRQRWLVTGGHIPWITVGTASGSFRIVDWGGAVKDASSASGEGWNGVRLDLDRDYRPGDAFDISFSLLQSGLFYAKDGRYGLDFTPGWYERAVTDSLVVSVAFFASLDSVAADPEPTAISGNMLTWGPYRLGAGERFTVHISFPVAVVPGGMARTNLKRGAGAAAVVVPLIFTLVFLLILVLVVVRAAKYNARRYSGGRMFYGGIFGAGGGRGGPGGGRSGSGGGGFGGASMSCACACVSCACACACAGGGGAGCARKLEHTCPACDGRSRS